MAVDIGGKNTEEEIRSELPSQQVQRSAQCWREVRWTVTPNEGKDSDSSDSRKTFITLIFDRSIDSFGFFFLFVSFFTPLCCSC